MLLENITIEVVDSACTMLSAAIRAFKHRACSVLDLYRFHVGFTMLDIT